MRSIRSFSCVLLVVGVLVSACTKKVPGDACRASPKAAICADATRLETCRAFTWHVDPCRGPAGCSSGACDQSVAAVNDSCGVDGARACSTDGTQVLRCDGGTMVAESTCRGERGCYRASTNAPPSCDLGAPQIGDACTPTVGGRCNADGSAVLQCSPQTHHVILERRCLGPKGCFLNPHFHDGGMAFLACDVSRGDVGEPCIGYAGVGGRIANGGSYCSTDGSELLTCKEGTLVGKAKCACAVSWAADLASWSVGCVERDEHVDSSSGARRGTRTVARREAAYLTVAEKP